MKTPTHSDRDGVSGTGPAELPGHLLLHSHRAVAAKSVPRAGAGAGLPAPERVPAQVWFVSEATGAPQHHVLLFFFVFADRDLKVDNVMISSDHKVKLIDFGFLCALEEGEEEFLGPQTGTIGYFAPESIPLSGYSVFSAKSDIW